MLKARWFLGLFIAAGVLISAAAQSYDAFWVEVSNDNGATWTRVETVAFTGRENQWVRRSFRVGDYVTPTAQVRVRFGTSDNPNDSIVEAGVDHFVARRIVCP